MAGSTEPDLSMKTYQVILIIMSMLVSLGSVLYIIWTFFLEKDLKAEMKEGKARIQDDMLIYPRCRTAAEEQSMDTVTSWKDYFTRDEKPFRKGSE